MEIEEGQDFIVPLNGVNERSVPLVMTWIEPGTFHMGSPTDEPERVAEEEEQFEATISRGFWLGKFLVTQAHWQAVFSNNPSHFHIEGENRPVENVSWHDAMAYCNQLNKELTVLLPTDYYFRLPTETEWEYACRAGTITMYYNGSDDSLLSDIAWHKQNSDDSTQLVGQKQPNAWGLYDIIGNVFEWCYDSTSGYPTLSTVDWIGIGDGSVRSIRSASYGTPLGATNFRCACRGYVDPDIKRPWFGFRLCLGGFIR